MSDYITLDELRYTLELSNESFALNDMSRSISTASLAIDELTDRRFDLDADALQVRYYTPSSAQIVETDDLVTLTTLKTDRDGDGTFETTWTLNTDFVLEPLNAAAGGKPFERIRRHPSGSYLWPALPRSVQVTGKFGWPVAPPAQVKTATTIIATRLLRRMREAPFGVVTVGFDGAAVRIARTDPDVMLLLEPFIRTTVLA